MLRGSDTGCLFHLPWLSEDVLDLGVELSGAPLHEAPQRVSDSRSVGSMVGSGAPKLSQGSCVHSLPGLHRSGLPGRLGLGTWPASPWVSQEQDHLCDGVCGRAPLAR